MQVQSAAGGHCDVGSATSFGTRGSQVQILPLRPAFPTLPNLTATDIATDCAGGYPVTVSRYPLAGDRTLPHTA